MTALIRYYQAEREAARKSEKVAKLPPPREPTLAYRLQRVVFVADRGYGESPRYAVETFDPDRGVGGLEFEGDDGIEALIVALAETKNRNAYGVRVEFVGPSELAEALE